MTLKLIIGNKNYSSWSLRPWLAMKVAGIAFDEQVISLDAEDFKALVTKVSGTGKVPALDRRRRACLGVAGDPRISRRDVSAGSPLAGRCRRPARRPARSPPRCMPASCRCVANCPMNMWRPVKPRQLTPEAAADVARIDAMWTDCRNRFGAGGPFLFGAFGAADAMYAPVVSRFHTYGVDGWAGQPRLYGRRDGAAGLGRMAGGGAREPWVLPRGRGRLADGPAAVSRWPPFAAAEKAPKNVAEVYCFPLVRKIYALS